MYAHQHSCRTDPQPQKTLITSRAIPTPLPSNVGFPGWMRLMFTCMLGARFLLQSHQYPNLSEGADRVAGQLRGDKECPFSGVTKSGRVWRKVPESGARSVSPPQPSAPRSPLAQQVTPHINWFFYTYVSYQLIFLHLRLISTDFSIPTSHINWFFYTYVSYQLIFLHHLTSTDFSTPTFHISWFFYTNTYISHQLIFLHLHLLSTDFSPSSW